MLPQERKQFANDAEDAVMHPLVQDAIDEYRHNMHNYGAELETGHYAYYGLLKVLTAATQTARAQALGIDPQELIMSPAEVAEHMVMIANAAAQSNKPVFIVEVAD